NVPKEVITWLSCVLAPCVEFIYYNNNSLLNCITMQFTAIFIDVRKFSQCVIMILQSASFPVVNRLGYIFPTLVIYVSLSENCPIQTIVNIFYLIDCRHF